MNLCGFGVLTEGAGNRVWVKRANGRGDVYQYDPTDQLTNVLYEATNPDATPSVWTNEVRYVFDAAGNRTSVTATNTGTTSYTANALNQYTAVGGVALGWDANGNPTNVVENGVTLSLTYDRENRLTRVDTGTVTVTNTYDAFHRLVERATGAGKLRFVYDNRWRVIAEYDGNDALVNKYVYGPEIDEPVRLTRSSARYYYHQAALGTVTELTGFLGNVRETYTYDVYGQPTLRNNVGTVITSSQFGNRFLFQGRDRDSDTGLYNFRYRTYSATLGRFLQVDPVRERGGMNLYSFVENRPVTGSDPLGLQPCPPLTNPVPNLPQFQANFSQHHASLDKDKGVQNTSGNAPVARPVVKNSCTLRGEKIIVDGPYSKTVNVKCGECGDHQGSITLSCIDYLVCDFVPVAALSGVTQQLQWVAKTTCK